MAVETVGSTSGSSRQQQQQRRGSRLSLDLLNGPIDPVNSFVSKRDGAVLSRGTILKSDHFQAGKTKVLTASGIVRSDTVSLVGGPNFRRTDLNVYGVAQPTVSGLLTVLNLLGCGVGPASPNSESTVTSSPCSATSAPEPAEVTWFSTREEPIIYINERPYILREEREPFNNMATYTGITAARLEALEARLKRDILTEARKNGNLLLVHEEGENCCVVPCLITPHTVQTTREVFDGLRGKGHPIRYHRVPIGHAQSPIDSFIDAYLEALKLTPAHAAVVFSCGIGVGRTTFSMAIGLLIRRALLMESQPSDPLPQATLDPTRQLLRVVQVLEKALRGQHSAIEWALQRDCLIESLMAAIKGDYQVIQELCRVLPAGLACKATVDTALDRCDHLVNLREQILLHRIQHSIGNDPHCLEAGISYLERYFSLIVLCAFLAERSTLLFAAWMRGRPEIWNMFTRLRRHRGPGISLTTFRPLDDLQCLADRLPAQASSAESREEEALVRHRSGTVLIPRTILKLDHWQQQHASVIAGAPNWRQIGEWPLYATAQPTQGAIIEILENLTMPICWINVREEPIVYINGEPYVLRDEHASIRNIRAYSGITADRLEALEERLKQDILHEAKQQAGRVLVHSEVEQGRLVPTWEVIETVETPLELMNAHLPRLSYYRIPITAEDSPDPNDFDAISRLIEGHAGHAFIFNCQMGAGRSTCCAVIASAIMARESPSASDSILDEASQHYRIIHSLLRMLPDGTRSKQAIDGLIDQAAAVVNLRQVTEDCRQQAEQAMDSGAKRRALQRGVAYLKRYTMLILYEAYLMQGEGESFAQWMDRHMEFATLMAELEHGEALETLQVEPDVRLDEAVPMDDASVLDVVRHRRGAVLAPMTILKYDHFPGCQKEGLVQRWEGAPNYREVQAGSTKIIGVAMPTQAAITNIVTHLKDCSTVWVSLREEPVIFINGLPFVLRIVKDPVANLEMTGIVSERVERMEERLKADCVEEARRYQGRLLLHEESLIDGGWKVTSYWTEAKSIQTPAEVYQSHQGVQYHRIPM